MEAGRSLRNSLANDRPPTGCDLARAGVHSQGAPSPHMFQGGRNYLGRARLGYTFFPLLPSP